jgi:hypothetical protein
MSKFESVRVKEPEHNLIAVEFYFQTGSPASLRVPRGTSEEDLSMLLHQFADLLWKPPSQVEQPPDVEDPAPPAAEAAGFLADPTPGPATEPTQE